MILTIIAIVWVVSALVGYRGMYTHFQTEYAIIADEDRGLDRIMAAAFALTGPVALLVWAAMTRGYPHGFSKW